MPAPLLIAFCAFCGTYAVKKIHDVFHKKEKNKRRKLELKGKTIEQAREDNKQAQAEIDDWKKKHGENEDKIKDLEKKIEDAKSKANDPDLSPEERSAWKNRVIQYEDEINTLRKNNGSILSRIKGLGDKIKNNNQVISGTVSNLDDRHWVWDLFTLENIMIGVAMYVGYKLLKDDKK